MRTSTAGNKGKLFSFSSSSLFSLSLSSPHRKMKNAIPLRRRIFPGQRNTPSRIRGFTLLELIVVISVMLLVLGLAVTSFRGESPARLLERSTLEFESFCAAVRYQAMEKGEDRIVVFVPETRVFRMRIPAPSADDEDGNGAYGEIFFPNGENSSLPEDAFLFGNTPEEGKSSIQWILPEAFVLEWDSISSGSFPDSPESPEEEEYELFRFFPNGSAAGKRKLSFRMKGMTRTMEVSALTGLLRVTKESSGMDFGGNNQEEDGKRKGWVSP